MIPAKPRQELKGLEAAAKSRVCAYCRVSTDNDDQLSSYEAQVEHAFSGKLFCQNCGSKFRRASWGTGKNKQYVWRCINREQNGVDKCSAKTIKEKALEQVFLRVNSEEKILKNIKNYLGN